MNSNQIRGNWIRTLGVLGAVAALGLTGCASGGAAEEAEATSEKVTLGYTATLSGDFASYGLEMREGIDLAVEQINADGGVGGRTLEIVSADDEGEPANGPVIAQQFCDDGAISAVLGYSFSSVALAAVPVYDQCGLPVVASAVTSPELTGVSEVFSRNVYTDAYQGALMGEFAYEQGLREIAVLFQQDDYGQGLAGAFADSFEAAGGTVTSSQAYQLGTVEFATIVDSALADSPDAFFLGGFYTETAKIAAQVRRSGSDLPLLGADGAVSPDLFALGGDAVEGMLVYSAFDAAAASGDALAFVEAFTEKYGKAPSSWAALAYDATFIAAEAVESAEGGDRTAVAEAIRATADFPGVTGATTIDAEGNRGGDIVFLEAQGGAFIAVTK